ncbi:DNA base-flipping protein [Silvimonas sp. JCM 19000]
MPMRTPNKTPSSVISVAIINVVARIPPQTVATYGQVAALAGYPRHSRLVGRALGNTDRDVPWFRVINSTGRVSARGLDGNDDLQRMLLQADGVEFGEGGRIDLKVWGWRPEEE